MKILTIDELLEVASELEIPEYQTHVTALETATTELAQSIAAHLEIKLDGEATWEGLEFGGLAASLAPAHESQPCPEIINQFDPGGDWN